jgi:ATP-dependent DNA ligase
MTQEVPLALQPMDAIPVDRPPVSNGWRFERKYDGFRCLLFRDRETVHLQSRRERPLGRYFPEIIGAASRLPLKRFVFDGELIIPDQPFDTLQLRPHPAASRVKLLSHEHPAQIIVFDLLADEQGHSLLDTPFSDWRPALESALKRIGLPLQPIDLRTNRCSEDRTGRVPPKLAGLMFEMLARSRQRYCHLAALTGVAQ